MQYPINWQDDNEIKRLFTWQTRVGLAPKFGSRPIGWYQQHQCAVYDIICNRLDTTKTDPKEVVMRRGAIITKNGVVIGRVETIYSQAENSF